MFEGSSSNTYTGTTNIGNGAAVEVRRFGTAMVIPGDIVVTGGGNMDSVLMISDNYIPNGQTVSKNQIADSSTVTLNNYETGAYLESNIGSEVIGSIAGNGYLDTMSGDASEGITIGGNNMSSAFGGILLEDGGTLTKIGTGALDLTGASSQSAYDAPMAIVINGGVLTIGGDGLGPNPLTLNNGTKLVGTGSIGATTAKSGSTVAIGHSPGCVTFGDLNLNSGSVWEQDIEGDTACTGYDQATIGGALGLSNATLKVNQPAGFSPAIGTSYTIMKNFSSLGGTFNGLANGATITVDQVTYTISYSDGAVTLTVSGINPTNNNNTTTPASGTSAGQSGVTPGTPDTGFVKAILLNWWVVLGAIATLVGLVLAKRHFAKRVS